jgi:opacity protein-like surface antigen
MGSGGGDTSYLFQGHVLYNFSLAGKIVPFIGGGAGVGNGLPIWGVIEGGSDYNSFVYVGMVGAKFMIGNSAAFRVEYRFNRFSWDSSFALEKEWGNLHYVLVGISVFF